MYFIAKKCSYLGLFLGRASFRMVGLWCSWTTLTTSWQSSSSSPWFDALNPRWRASPFNQELLSSEFLVELLTSTHKFFSLSISYWEISLVVLLFNSEIHSPVTRYSVHVITYQLGHITNVALHVWIIFVKQTPPGPGDASEMFPVTQIMMSSIFV